MANSAKTELREVHYSGDVQGVGFRATTRDIARQLAVTGWVMNLPDGRVKLVAEGTGAELERLEQEIRRRLAGHIADVVRDTRPATGQFRGFEIRY